jgi:hypothetical protein
MLLYTHPLNAEREERGALPLNSFWLSGCGPRQVPSPVPGLHVDSQLRAPALAEDWAAWAEAWQRLDAGFAVQSTRPATLVLCGERSAVHFATRSRSLWQRLQGTLRGASATALLETL